MGELKRRGQIWWIRYYKNGRRYEESSGSTKEAAAKGLLRLREGDIERGVAMTPKVGRIVASHVNPLTVSHAVSRGAGARFSD